MTKTIAIGVALAISGSLLGGCSAGITGGTMLPASQISATHSIDSVGGGPIQRNIDSGGGGPISRNIDSGGGGPISRNIDSGGGGPILRNIDSGGGGPIRGAKKRFKPADSVGGGPIIVKAH
jgi:hypothetical protein